MPGKPITKAVGVTDAEVKKLLHVGFSVAQVRFIVGTAKAAADQKKWRAHNSFSKAQVQQLVTGPRTMKSLLLAKFTRSQAKVLLEILGA